VTTVALPKTPPELAALMARQIRELGIQRIISDNPPTREARRDSCPSRRYSYLKAAIGSILVARRAGT
jgi:hypothetical protein